MDTAMGAIGALDVILRRSMEGLNFWQRIKDFSESAKTFQALLDWQRARLTTWKEEWAFESNNYHQNRRFRIHEPLVTNHLQEINSIFNDFGSRDTPGPVLTQTNKFNPTGVLPGADYLGTFSGPHDGGSPDAPALSSMQSIKWALQEDKLKHGLALLTKLVDDLFSFLPPPRHDPARTLILSDSITTSDPNDLARISHVEIDDPIYTSLVWTKSINHRMYGTYLGNHQLHASLLMPIEPKKGRTKFMARYQGELVLVEEKQCTAAWGQLGQLNILKARIDNIVVLLQNPKKPTGLRTLPCRGSAFSKGKPSAEDRTTWTYNIVYRADYPRFTSLRNVLSQTDKTLKSSKPAKAQFPLGKRFILARTLARALMYLHLADWLHKAVRSENVVFFLDDENRIQTHLPYLVGFEHSRLDVAEEKTENVEEKPDHRFYRHPKAMVVPVSDLQQPLGGPGRHSKVYDIYSTGVVLLEIGLFMSARSITKKYGASEHATLVEIRKVFIEKAITDLRFAMGNVYADAVLACLDGSLDEFVDQSLHQAFYKNVVGQLDICLA